VLGRKPQNVIARLTQNSLRNRDLLITRSSPVGLISFSKNQAEDRTELVSGVASRLAPLNGWSRHNSSLVLMMERCSLPNLGTLTLTMSYIIKHSTAEGLLLSATFDFGHNLKL
jgi:hypothetical protein